MSLASRPNVSKGLSIAALAATTLAVAGIGFLNTDRMVELAYAEALDAPAAVAKRDKSRGPGPAVAGTEEFWLGEHLPAGAARVAWVRGVNVGDRILIGAGDRALQIVDLHELSGEAAKLIHASMRGHLVLVTAREEGSEAGVVRFIVDAETFSTATKVAKAPAAL